MSAWWERLDDANHREAAKWGRLGRALMHRSLSPLRWLCSYREYRYGVPRQFR